MNEKTFYAIITVIIAVGGIGIGAVYYHTMSTSGGGKSVTGTEISVYHLNLMEIMDGNYNSSVGAQPIFYVIQNGHLQSSSNISVPSHVEIQLTITSYDMGNGSVDPKYLAVQGTSGDRVTLIDGMNASGTNTSSMWAQQVSSFSPSQVVHTFTILNGTSVLVNIPMVAGDTEIATLYLNNTGTFIWQCEVACGTGASGWEGAMSTPGWMEGSVSVH